MHREIYTATFMSSITERPYEEKTDRRRTRRRLGHPGGLGNSRPGPPGGLGNRRRKICYAAAGPGRNGTSRPLAPPMSRTPRKSAAPRPGVRRRPSPPPPVAAAPRWTFLTNHAHVLILISKAPDTVLREVAFQVGITERAVQRIIADLERDGFLEREKVGRKNSYRIRPNQPLRHPIEAHRSIGDLIDMV